MIELYHYWRSSASWRVRLALEWKQIPWKSHHINLLAGEEKKPDYLQKNPSGYLPCLVIGGGKYIGESLPIIEWLETQYSQRPLLPADTFERALVRQFAETVNSGIQPLINLDVVRHFSPDAQAQQEWSQHWLKRGLGVLERQISSYKGDFAFGDQPTLADICLVPQCYSAERNAIDLSAFPRIAAIYKNILQQDFGKKSHPNQYKPTN